MRRSRGLKRGRWLSLLVAGIVGYLLGGWHAVPSRSTDLSASQYVALRFPEAKADNAAVDAAADMPTDTTISTKALKQARLALLSPQPMVPVIARPPAEPQIAAISPASAVTAPAPAAMPSRSEAKFEAKSEAKFEAKSAAPPVAAAAHHPNRPGFLLNDAQIGSIKERLHLTPDQERMWPAVEAALRNVAYAKVRTAHRHDAPGSEVASLDAESAEVQGLKSAAIPLLMSFNDEQKNEVRSLAHVMGLDKLASEF
jgi:hypothetical protein